MAYYGKLPILLLSELAAGKEDSYNCRIAAWLLGHLGESVSAETIARECYVSRSAVSRFCREVGLEDFSQLKDLLSASEKIFVRVQPESPAKSQGTTLARLASESMALAAETLDYESLDRLALEISRARQVLCFGLLKAETAALALQSDLVMLGKNCVTKVAFRDQMDLLAAASGDDLAVIFSYRGIFFDYDLPREALSPRARLWLVSGSPEAEDNLRRAGVRYSGVLTFSSRQDFASHPFQLMAVAGIIAQRCAALAEGKPSPLP